MDFQNRVGSRTGGGGVAGWSETNRDRRERLRKLALETIDLARVGFYNGVHYLDTVKINAMLVLKHRYLDVYKK